MIKLATIVGVFITIIVIALAAIVFLFDWRSGSVNQYLEKDGTKIQK